MSSMDPELDEQERGVKPSTGKKPVDGPAYALDLFGSVAHARRTDPPTSAKAAQDVTRRDMKNAGEMVLHILREFGPMTDEKLVEVYEQQADKRKAFLPQSPSGIRTRRSELTRAGRVEEAGQGLTKLGKPAMKWRASKL